MIYDRYESINHSHEFENILLDVDFGGSFFSVFISSFSSGIGPISFDGQAVSVAPVELLSLLVSSGDTASSSSLESSPMLVSYNIYV